MHEKIGTRVDSQLLAFCGWLLKDWRRRYVGCDTYEVMWCNTKNAGNPLRIKGEAPVIAVACTVSFVSTFNQLKARAEPQSSIKESHYQAART